MFERDLKTVWNNHSFELQIPNNMTVTVSVFSKVSGLTTNFTNKRFFPYNSFPEDIVNFFGKLFPRPALAKRIKFLKIFISCTILKSNTVIQNIFVSMHKVTYQVGYYQK